MARVTIEDCLEQTDGAFSLVKLAASRARRIANGSETLLEDEENDKPTVLALREIAEEKIIVKDLVESAVYKLRQHVEQVDDTSDDDEVVGDDFENLYRGEISRIGLFYLEGV